MSELFNTLSGWIANPINQIVMSLVGPPVVGAIACLAIGHHDRRKERAPSAPQV